MEALSYLDTHVLVWLYAGEIDRLSDTARDRLQHTALLISPMVRLELQYLYEIGRTSEPAGAVVGELEAQISLRTCDQPFMEIVAMAEKQEWTRDPFDRIIVAQAALNNTVLLTKDGSIQQNYTRAVW